MSPSSVERTVDTLEKDLGNLNLLEVLLILTILIFTTPIAFVIHWLTKRYGYFKKNRGFLTNHYRKNYANK